MAKGPRSNQSRKRQSGVLNMQEGIGPYEYWNFGRGKDYALPSLQTSRYLTALAELRPAHKTRTKRARPAHGEAAQIWLPTLWKKDDNRKEKTRKNGHPIVLSFVPFIIAKPKKSGNAADDPVKLHKRLLEGLHHPDLQEYLESIDIDKSRFRVGLPVAEPVMKPKGGLEPTRPNWHPDRGLRARIGPKKRITIFAIIDDGLPFAHRNFRDATGQRSRVEFCWLQSAEADERQTSVRFGREYTRTEIENAIAQHGNDEDALYREAGATADTADGLASLIERHATHGAHVMDLATGYSRERGEQPAEEIRIIAVQLPNVVTMDTSGVGKDMYLLSAFHYIFHRADLIADKYGIERPRLVINFSYGYSAGPHDGRIDIEAAIGQLIEKRRKTTGPTALVLPAGNSFLDRMHANILDAKFHNGEARIQWRLQPCDRTPNYVEIWFPAEFNPVGYTVAVKDPGGVERASLPVGLVGRNRDRMCLIHNDDNRTVGQFSVDQHRKHRWRALIITAPSDPEHPGCPAIEAGAWTIVINRALTAAKLGPQGIRCWVQRDSDPESLRSGARQSYFDQAQDIRYNDDGSMREMDTTKALVRRFGSLSGLATGPQSTAVAGVRLAAGLGSSPNQVRPAQYSCAGTQSAEASEPRIACSSMSDRSKALPGTVAAGTRSGSRSVLQGTSMAAPFVARQLATTFVSASDRAVKKAELGNYLDLLRGYRPDQPNDRLGQVLVSAHRQPGIERETA